MDKPRFNLGDTVFYVEANSHSGFYRPCEMCFGKKKVTIIIGNGEQIDSECGFCKRGVDPPSGQCHDWDARSEICEGTITGIELEYSTPTYRVHGRSLRNYALFSSREEAEPLMQARLKEVQEQRRDWFKSSFVNAKSSQIWSTGYHRNQIKSHERNIEWHRMRLCMIKDKHTPPEPQGE